jgi:competence protein ComEC
VEINLVCPTDMVGKVDLFMVNHHGMAVSNSAELLAALSPKAVIMNNGERKGAQPDTMKRLKAAPGSPDVWLNHFSITAGKELNPPENFIANMAQQDCQAKMIKVSAKADGSFTITNTRNNFSKTYK